ncbi:MAG: selenium-binding protein SBP56-related protein [Candidatus Binatia bacterium]
MLTGSGQKRRGRAWSARAAALALCLSAAPAPAAPMEQGAEPARRSERYLLVWTGDDDRRDEDFLAVIDADPTSKTYGKVLKTVPVGSKANEPHHIDYVPRPEKTLWGSGLLTSRTFVFDIATPPDVKLMKVDEPSGDGRRLFAPHSYIRLANGNTLSSFQESGDFGRSHVHGQSHGIGGLVEFDPRGNFVREISAADPEAKNEIIAPYSLQAKPSIDRLVTTNEAHGFVHGDFTPGRSVQVWRLSDLKLLKTVVLPVGPRGTENWAPFEPRFVHAPGKPIVFLNPDLGGSLYVSENIDSPNPTFQLVYDFGASSLPGVPVITRDDRLMIVPLEGATEDGGNRIVVLDISTPSQPRKVSELHFNRDPESALTARFGRPHWVTLSRDESRIAASCYTIDVPGVFIDGDRRIYMVKFDNKSGAMAFDTTWRDEVMDRVGVSFTRTTWPHGATGPARPHGMMLVD